MSEIYKVKIGDVFLTSDGTETGRGCLLEILNISKLREMYKKTVIESVDGSQVTQIFEVTDVPFAVSVFRVYKPVGDLLVDLYNDSAASGELVSFEATGGGNVDFLFDVEIVSFDYKDTEFGWENAQLNLIKK
jgi:hypothetical protein